MSAVNILAPGQDLIEEIIHRLSPPQQDFSNDVVVFPGKRPAHTLRKALAGRVGGSFLPPKIYSIDTFIEYLHNSWLKINKPTLSTLDAVAILFDVHRQLTQRLGHDAYLALDAFLPVGIKLVGELEEVLLAHLPERRIREVLSGVQFQKFHSLSAYYEAFYQEVERRGYVTRATRYRTVAERINEINFSDFRNVILAGFYAFTNVEKRIVAHLKQFDNVTLLFQQGVGLQKQLQALGISAEAEAAFTAAPEVQFIKAPDLHGQVFALAAQLEKQMSTKNTIDQRTAVVLPSSEALFPVVHFALSMLPEDSYNIALQYPLTRTPIYGFLNSLMDFVASAHNGKFSSSAYLKFVLHPYTKNIRFGQRTEVTRVFFHAAEEHFVEHYAKVLFSLEELENDEKLFKEVEKRLAGAGEKATGEELREHLVTIHKNTIRKLLGVLTVRQLAERAMEVLSYIYTHSTANLHPYFRPYVQRLMEVLDDIRASLLAEYTFDDPLTAFMFLKRCIAAESVPFPGIPLNGLQTLGLLETRNLTFDTLYILDATDDVLPGRPSQDMLLPHNVRVLLGLETYRDAERLVEYYFDLAVRSAKRVYLLYSESDEREKSRFVQKLLWQLQQKEVKMSADEYEQQVKYNVRLVNDRPKKVEKTQAMVDAVRAGLRFSAHALDTYLDCPLKFYYRYVLRLAEREEVSDEMEATDIGELVHNILARYFEPLRERRLVRGDFRQDRLDRIVDECFEETFGKDLTGTVLLLRRQVEHQLWQFLNEYQAPLASRETVQVLSTEQTVEVEYNGYRFTGRIDRIEQRGDRTFILDYKTGANEKKFTIKLDKLDVNSPNTWRDAIRSFQLPIYMLLYSQATKEKLSSLAPSYLFLGKKRIDEDIEYGIGDEKYSPADVFAAIEPVIMKTIEMILDPNLPFTPTRELEKECPRCPFNTICGTQWVHGWNAG